jgi:hypothetical protein
MFVVMKKIREDSSFVYYRFETSPEISKTVYGFCKFGKHTGEFSIEQEKTDKYFLGKANRYLLWVHLQLHKFKEMKTYPEVYTIAYG